MMLGPRLAFLDLETTGADPREDRVTEIGIVLVDHGEPVEEWSSLVNPGRSIPAGVEALTGISDDMVAQAPAFSEIVLDVAARLHDRLLIAHNARFDYGFLRHEFRRSGSLFEARVLCTVRLSRALFPDERHHNLDALIARFALACEARHRALPDARALVGLTRAMAQRVPAAAFGKAVDAVISTPQLPAGLDARVLEDLPDMPGAYLLRGPAGEPLFAGRAANLRTQVLAHWGERGPRAKELRTALLAGGLEWMPSAGALGSALHQLRLIETLAPRHNRPPRAQKEAWALGWQPGEDLVRALDLNGDEGALLDLFGPFRSRQDALAALRGLSREHRLCTRALGLEPGSGPCSGVASGRCGGLCSGLESRAAHTLRLVQALARLRLAPWPFPGAIALVEEDPARTRRELHVVRDWRHLGSARTRAEAFELLDVGTRTPAFDVDIYRLLKRALDETGRFGVERLDAARR